MNIEATILLELIKKSQFGTTEDIIMDGIDIDTLYDEAMSQSVLGLVASEIPSAYINEKWIQARYRTKASYIRYCHAEDELKELLDKNPIPFVILKGNAAAVSYKDPSCRTMGDIDFLVPQEFFEIAKKVLNENGYREHHNTNRHIAYKKGNYTFELHHHFSHEIDIEDYLINEMKNPVIATINNHSFTMLPKLSNGLILLDHLRSHIKQV